MANLASAPMMRCRHLCEQPRNRSTTALGGVLFVDSVLLKGLQVIVCCGHDFYHVCGEAGSRCAAGM